MFVRNCSFPKEDGFRICKIFPFFFWLMWFLLVLFTTTKRSFYIGWKRVSTTGPTPSLFQMSLYVDNNDIGHTRTHLCNVRIQRQCLYNNRRYKKWFDDAHGEEPVVVVVHFNVGYAKTHRCCGPFQRRVHEGSSLLWSSSTSGTPNTCICWVFFQHRRRVHPSLFDSMSTSVVSTPSLFFEVSTTGFYKDRRWSSSPAHKIWVIPFKFQKQSYTLVIS